MGKFPHILETVQTERGLKIAAVDVPSTDQNEKRTRDGGKKQSQFSLATEIYSSSLAHNTICKERSESLEGWEECTSCYYSEQ
ncbi:hypothetical protein KIN20_009969 [Parelaphostrongylus tenuis]|uniref:Uncharacterized protein n=1 Tax=Parelaphostrongylus tenuis TaxID=148309 RepID=A0AAD5M8X5_PARTN|nr:hypothetical protein KIN20_009969 [Parelaphostrongylus tenuis]